ncbi:hypothetical protein [Mycolicibacterium gadium]|uniref:hypothetical protein n=1 Tax=Mycolicibacterium gadium TaxID=1794 RepID=UPI002FDD4289
MVDPTRGARIRTGATREQKSDRALRKLPLRALSDQDFEDVVLRNAHPPTRDREIWTQLTAPDLIGRTRQTLTDMHARNSGAMRRKKAALSAFHAQCLKMPRGGQEAWPPRGGQEAWVQAKADYEQWKVGASNFERTVSGALAEVDDIWELRTQQRGSSGVLQAQLTRALNAIRTHRDACDTADIEPEEHDLALWSTLEHVAGTDDTLTSQGAGVAD